MAIIKKNLLSIIFIVIAVVAMVAAFWPLGGYYDDLQANLEKSKGRYEKVASLLKKPRTTPVVAPGQKPEALVSFPTLRDIKDATTAQEKLHTEGRNILAQAVVKNIQEILPEGRSIDASNLDTFNPNTDAVKNAVLLVPRSLPDPSGNAPFAFQKELENELKRIRETVLKGGLPPAQADIDKATAALRAQMDSQLQFVEKDKPALNQVQVDAEFDEKKLLIPARLREEAASKFMLYIEPGVLQVDPSIKLGTPSKEQIWFAQSALWIQEDVARAIKETNALPRFGNKQPATNVRESLVKRLVRLDVPLGPDMYQRGSAAGAAVGGENVPAAAPMPGRRGGYTPPGGGGEAAPLSIDVIPGANEPPKTDPAISATGRASNNLYDVIHFNIVVDVDARAAQVFLDQLSRGRLIAVRKVDTARPDLAEGASFGYVYARGKETVPVLQMSLDCEALLLRDWTIPLMPVGAGQRPSIREMLGVPPTFVSVLAPPKKEDAPK